MPTGKFVSRVNGPRPSGIVFSATCLPSEIAPKRCNWRLGLCGVLLLTTFNPPLFDAAALGQTGASDTAPEEEWEEEEQALTGRSFFYKELVLSGFYSPEGLTGVPPDDRSADHFELSPRPPGSYIGVDYARTFTSSSYFNSRVLPEWMPLNAIDLHPRIVYDRLEEDEGLDPAKLAPQDFWARFNPGGVDRFTLRIGQFVIPYGSNPIHAPRQSSLLPVESTDLGLKWDWGIDLKGPIGKYDWEIATTIGAGETLHSPRLLSNSDRTSYLITGRIGAPTYWDLQYGLSFLYGDLPLIRGAKVLGNTAISRWRIGLDSFYKYGTYLMAGAQVTFGQDGFAGDEEFVRISGGKTAEVLGYRGWLDWVIPAHQDLRPGFQIESVLRDLATSDSDDTAAIVGIGYSLTTAISLKLDYRFELNGAMGTDVNDAIFFTFVYYGR